MANDSLKAHKKLHGKIGVVSRAKLKSKNDLSLWYTPGVGRVASHLGKFPRDAREYTIKRNSIAVISDGTSVLGLGDIGPYGALPVMEGKAMIFKEFAQIDAFPIVLDTKDPKEVIKTVKYIAPAFGGINLEDISAPRCFEIEECLKKELDIPVFHDDQHGTAIVVLAGLLNASKVVRKDFKKMNITIAGAGAAGTAIANLLLLAGIQNIRVVDSNGLVSSDRKDLNQWKKILARRTHARSFKTFDESIKNSDVLIGVARAGLFKPAHIRSMNSNPIVFALSNPIPEIMPEEAVLAGAAVVATGRSDFSNQVNNALVFPGIFRGALDNHVPQITDEMKIRAARNLASLVKRPSHKKIIPSIFERGVMKAVSSAIR